MRICTALWYITQASRRQPDEAYITAPTPAPVQTTVSEAFAKFDQIGAGRIETGRISLLRPLEDEFMRRARVQADRPAGRPIWHDRGHICEFGVLG